MDRPGMNLLNRLGPGLLFAASAVGTSHLVQSTRAGADHSMGLIAIFVVVAILKYPGIRFGKDYAQATGNSLVHSYTSLGRIVTLVYALIIALSMVFVTAALALVTNGLLQTALSVSVQGSAVTISLILATGLLLLSGRYALLETLNKFLVPLFTVLIVGVTILVSVTADWTVQSWSLPAWNAANVFYVVAIAGWLLTPMDASVLVSLWTCEKNNNGHLNASDALFDFNLGYWGSLVLAACFVILGANLLFEATTALPSSSGAFAATVVRLFSAHLGAWSFPVIALIALSIMYSTLITVMDGYARNVEKLLETAISKPPGNPYFWGLGLVCVGSVSVVAFFMQSFTSFIDLVGALVFILGPVYAVLNHRAVFGGDILTPNQPSNFMRYWSMIGIVVMSAVALAYIYLRWL